MLTAGTNAGASCSPDLRRWRTALIHLNSYRHRLLLTCALSCGVAGFGARAAVAQNAPAAPPAPAAAEPPVVHGSPIVSATKVLPKIDPASSGVINRYIQTEVALLSHPSAKARADARLYLERGLVISPPTTPPTQPSKHYLTTYAFHVSAAVQKPLASPDPQVRLNAAIVVQTIAERVVLAPADRSADVYLAPAVLVALKDKAEPVVLWGAKAAQFVLPSLLDDPKNAANAAQGKAVADALLQVLRDHPASGPISEDVAIALTGSVDSAAPPARVGALIEYVLKMEAGRVSQYAGVNVAAAGPNGLDLPGSPAADGRALGFFGDSRVWEAAGKTAGQKQQIMRTAFDVMTQMVRLADSIPQGPGAGGEVRREDVLNVIKRGGEMVQLNLGRDNHPAEAKALGGPLAQISSGTNPATIGDLMDKLQAGLQQFNLLAPPRPAPAAGAAAAPVARFAAGQ